MPSVSARLQESQNHVVFRFEIRRFRCQPFRIGLDQELHVILKHFQILNFKSDMIHAWSLMSVP